MLIDVIDVTDPLLVMTKVALEQRGRSKVLTYQSMSNGIGQMVEDICRLLGPQARFDPRAPVPRTAAEQISALTSGPRKIEALRIWGHGDIGAQNISAGKDGSGVVPHRTGLSPQSVRRERAALERLRPYFTSNGRAELRGCAVGRGFDGVDFLKQLAQLWHVTMYGAVELQPGTGLDWYGPVYQVSPSGESRIGSGVPV